MSALVTLNTSSLCLFVCLFVDVNKTNKIFMRNFEVFTIFLNNVFISDPQSQFHLFIYFKQQTNKQTNK